MNSLFKSGIAFLFLATFGLAGCQTPATNTNVNVKPSGNTNINSNFSNANANLAPTGSVAVEASEPDQYKADVTLKVEAGGNAGGEQKTTALPSLKAQVAKMGNDKRMEFALPNGEKLIYLEKGGQQFVIAPQRKQYAELNKESLGFDIRQMMSPAQIVSQVKNQKGVQRVGEEKYAGRDAVKYRYDAVTNTNTQAGNVATEAVIFVDKETGLPLRSETYAQSQGGQVNGMNNIRFVTEMSNLSTTAEASLFEVPTDYKKVESEQIRAQAELVFKIIGAFLQNAMNQANTNTAPASPTPAQ